jgi:chromate reductase, NAD(P)H dehydrogenase (quinone)
MYLIISATNRTGSNTKKVATQLASIFKTKNIDAKLLSLEVLTETTRGNQMNEIEQQFLLEASKIIIVAPEYNGTFPGILKLCIDNSDIKKVWWHKKAMLVGVASGRAGNLRGLDHLTNALNYLKMNVLPNKMPLSSIDGLLGAEGVITDEGTLKALQQQVEEFIAF